MSLLNIKDIPKEKIFQALYNNSYPNGMGYFDYVDENLDLSEAKRIIIQYKEQNNSLDFDYFRGRVIKCDFSGDTLNPEFFDKHNGEGACKKALSDLLKEGKNE